MRFFSQNLLGIALLCTFSLWSIVFAKSSKHFILTVQTEINFSRFPPIITGSGGGGTIDKGAIEANLYSDDFNSFSSDLILESREALNVSQLVQSRWSVQVDSFKINDQAQPSDGLDLFINDQIQSELVTDTIDLAVASNTNFSNDLKPGDEIKVSLSVFAEVEIP